MESERTRHTTPRENTLSHNYLAVTTETSPQEPGNDGAHGVQTAIPAPQISAGSREQTTSNVLFWTRRAFVAGALLIGLLIFVPWVSASVLSNQASLWQLATGEERVRGADLDLAASGIALVVLLSLSLYCPAKAGGEMAVTRTRLALLPWVAFAATDLFWSYQFSTRQEYLSLEWGIWLTWLVVLGVFGTAWFQIVSLRREAQEEDFGPLKSLRKVSFVALGLLAVGTLVGAASIEEGELYGLGIDSRFDAFAAVILDMLVLIGVALVGQSVGRGRRPPAAEIRHDAVNRR